MSTMNRQIDSQVRLELMSQTSREMDTDLLSCLLKNISSVRKDRTIKNRISECIDLRPSLIDKIDGSDIVKTNRIVEINVDRQIETTARQIAFWTGLELKND